jgi:AcrR family transcriptional regulator
MAKVNFERRAQIGRERSERTRQTLLSVARGLYAERPASKVTVDDIIARSGLAKGTFYYHFHDLTALTNELALELASEFARSLAALREPLSSPMARVARGVDGHLRYVTRHPEWGRIVVNALADFPRTAIPNRPDLIEDLQMAQEAGQLRFENVALAADIVIAMVIEATASICSGTYRRSIIPETVAAVLRALGLTPAAADKLVARIEKMPPPDQVRRLTSG